VRALESSPAVLVTSCFKGIREPIQPVLMWIFGGDGYRPEILMFDDFEDLELGI